MAPVVAKRTFNWYHAVLNTGVLAAGGTGTVVFFKRIVVPRIKAWINKVVSERKEKEAKLERDRIHAELLSKPPHGTEVYISGIPADLTEEELKEFCKAAGEVVEVTIVRKEAYAIAFVSFRTVDMASKAIEELHKSEFMGKKVRCAMSHTQNTIFIGNIPSQWGDSELKDALNQVGPGVICVLVMMDSLMRQRRGYWHVAYYNNACAHYSYKKMLEFGFKFGTNSPTVGWSAAKMEVHVKNLPLDVTVKQIKELFERHGDIVSVSLPPPKPGYEKRHAFVHFRERADAMKALQKNERHELNGEVLDCSLAKPQADKKRNTGATMHRGPPVVMPSYSSWPGYGISYGSVPSVYLAPPVMGPSGMAMVPVANGHLVYGMQQTAGTSSQRQ